MPPSTRARLRRGSLVLCALLAACDRSAPASETPPPTFKPVVTTRQLMEEVLEPAANVYWESVATVTDRSGTHERAPRSPEEWVAVRNAATVVAESGNLLMLDAHARNHDEWIRLARALVEQGDKARKAADARDPKAVFDAGAELYDACVSCHAIYLVGEKATAQPVSRSPAP